MLLYRGPVKRSAGFAIACGGDGVEVEESVCAIKSDEIEPEPGSLLPEPAIIHQSVAVLESYPLEVVF